MAYSEELATKVRKHLARSGALEKKMFGGLGFLINGNMSVGVRGEELLVRLDPAETAAALKEPGARLFDISGRPMKGWLVVGGAGIKDEPSLANWVRRGARYAASLPKK
jgi:TfoX/Sxy family transcriptional regulator of competence genes